MIQVNRFNTISWPEITLVDVASPVGSVSLEQVPQRQMLILHLFNKYVQKLFVVYINIVVYICMCASVCVI